MARQTALVLGALGSVGRGVIEHLDSLPDWDAIGVARRAPDFETRARFLSVDLRDAEDCRAKLGGLAEVTHGVYAAVFEKPNVAAGWRDPDHVTINLEMLRNAIEPVAAGARGLRHVTLLQGTKAYGAHLGPFKVPAREDEPRYWGPNFYYAQEDWLAAEAARRGFAWTVLRPQIVCGVAVGSNLNVMAAIGTYCAISRELGLPLRFPGGEPRLQEATDNRLLARAVAWAGTTPAAAGQAFNVANGDCYVWHDLFPMFARWFGMEYAGTFPCSLQRVMADEAPVWDAVVARHGLRPYRLDQMVPSWQFADFVFGYGQRPNPAIVSTIKARRAGFHDCIDTEAMFRELLAEMQRRRLIPG